MNDDLYVVLMAGGSGTRFWPASLPERPKQFLTIAGERSMIGETVARLEGLVPIERTLIVAGESHVPLVKEAIPYLPEENLLAEPVGRNTLPCVALAAFEIARRDPNAVQIVLPADHVIRPHESFRASLSAAAHVARERDVLVTLGIRPTFPETGYGYIEAGDSLAPSEGHPVFDVLSFEEKPELEVAKKFFASGRHLWNSGIFVWKTSTILRELELHAPEVVGKLRDARAADLPTIYPGLPAESIDDGVMEKAEHVAVLPIDYSWSDVGSWAALPEVHPQDGAGNTSAGGGELVAEDARNNVVFSDKGRLTALVGVEDLIVVHAHGATLVCPRDRAQDVRKIVEALKRGR